MSQHSQSLSLVEPNTRAAVNPETPVSSLEICHILSKQTCYATITDCYATVIQPIFSSWKVFFFISRIIWCIGCNAFNIMCLWDIISRTGQLAWASIVTMAEEWMLGTGQTPLNVFCSDICNMYWSQHSTFGFNVCFAYWVQTKTTCSLNRTVNDWLNIGWFCLWL